MNRFLYLNRFVTSFADFGLMFLIPLFVFQSTGSAPLAGLAFSIEYLVKVFFNPLAGLFIDRHPLVNLMSKVNIARAAISLVIGLCLLLLSLTEFKTEEVPVFVLIVILAAFNGFGFALNFMAQETLLTELISRDKFAKTQAKVQSLEQIALVTAPIIFSTALVLMPFHWLLVVIGLIFLMANLLLLRGAKSILVREPADKFLTFKERLAANLSVGQLYLLHSKPLQRIVLSTLLINVIYGTLLAIGAPAVIGLFAKDASSFATLQTTGALAAIFVLMMIVKGSHRVTPTQLGLIAFVFMTVGGLIAGLASSFIMFVAGAMLILGFDGMFNVYIRTRRMEIIARKDYGKAMGLLMVVNNVSKPLSGLLVFSLGHWFSVLQILMCATLCASALIISLRLFNTANTESVSADNAGGDIPSKN